MKEIIKINTRIHFHRAKDFSLYLKVLWKVRINDTHIYGYILLKFWDSEIKDKIIKFSRVWKQIQAKGVCTNIQCSVHRWRPCALFSPLLLYKLSQSQLSTASTWLCLRTFSAHWHPCQGTQFHIQWILHLMPGKNWGAQPPCPSLLRWNYFEAHLHWLLED